MLIFLYIAGIASVVTFLIHVIKGGEVVARPLLADQSLPVASKWLNYYCWHLTSLMIAFIAAAFLLAVRFEGPIIFVIYATGLAAGSSALSAWVALKAGISPIRFPSTSCFAVIALFGIAALLTS